MCACIHFVRVSDWPRSHSVPISVHAVMGALSYMSTPLSINCWQLVPPPESESYHDDVVKWKHFPRYGPFVWGIQWSLVNSTHKVQWCGALMTFTAQNVSTRRWCACVRFCQRNFLNSTSKYKFLSVVPLCIFIWYHLGSRTQFHFLLFTLGVSPPILFTAWMSSHILPKYTRMGRLHDKDPVIRIIWAA